MTKAPKELRVVLDMESFYSQDYGLRNKRYSTSLYIRGDQFKAHCMGIWLPDEEAYPKIYWYEDIAKRLKEIDWSRATLVAHHTHFDGLLLSHHYGVVAKKYACTMSMSRAWHGSHSRSDLDSICRYYGIGGKIVDIGTISKNVGFFTPGGIPRSLFGDYCRIDVMRCWYAYLRMLEEGFPAPELDIIDRTVRMFADPILVVDRALARKELERERTERADKIDKTDESLEDLRSREAFAQMLRDKGVEPPTKVKERKNKETGETELYTTYAFSKQDMSFLALRDHPDAEINDLVEAKLAASSTIGESRAQALLDRSIKIYDPDKPSEKRNAGGCTAPLPIYLNYAKAHTLRWSGGDNNNPQNFPSKSRGDKVSRIRSTVRAPAGHVLVVVDSAQIEARVNGCLAQEKWLMDAFRQRRDVYSEQAAELYRRPINKDDNPNERFVGKVMILGLGYQMSAPKFRYTLALGAMGPVVHLSVDVAAEAVAAYRSKNSMIKAQWDKLGALIRVMAYGREPVHYGPMTFERNVVHMPAGLKLYYPELRFEDNQWVYWNGKHLSKIYGGLLTENLVQSLARQVVAEQMLALPYRMVMTSHDEFVFCVPRKQADACLEHAIKQMHVAPLWMPDLPVAAEGKWNVTYDK